MISPVISYYYKQFDSYNKYSTYYIQIVYNTMYYIENLKKWI